MQTQVTELKDMKGYELHELLVTIINTHKNLPLDTYHAEIQTVLDEMNRRGKAIAKKYNKRYYDFVLRDFSPRYYEGK